MKVGIVGAGSIGLWFAGRLADAGVDVSVLARGRTLSALTAGGVNVQSNDSSLKANVTVSDDATTLGRQYLVIFTVKAHDLSAAAESAESMIDADSLILPAMNGVPWWFLETAPSELSQHAIRTVDPAGRCAALLPVSQVVGCVVHASCFVVEPGTVQHVMGNSLILGAASTVSPQRLSQVEKLFTAAKFDTTVSDDIRYDIWYKLLGNMTMNPLSALTGATCDIILDEPGARTFASAVMDEAAEIGAAIGCEITKSPDDRHAITRKLGAFKTSMLQDAEAGRPLEISALLEAPQEIARFAGISTPSLDYLLGLMRVFNKAR